MHKPGPVPMHTFLMRGFLLRPVSRRRSVPGGLLERAFVPAIGPPIFFSTMTIDIGRDEQRVSRRATHAGQIFGTCDEGIGEHALIEIHYEAGRIPPLMVAESTFT